MFENDIEEMLKQFGGKLKYVTHEHPEKNYRNGFLITLRLIGHLRVTQRQFSYGAVKAVVNGDKVIVGPGFLNDIARVLALIAQGIN